MRTSERPSTAAAAAAVAAVDVAPFIRLAVSSPLLLSIQFASESAEETLARSLRARSLRARSLRARADGRSEHNKCESRRRLGAGRLLLGLILIKEEKKEVQSNRLLPPPASTASTALLPLAPAREHAHRLDVPPLLQGLASEERGRRAKSFGGSSFEEEQE